MWDQCLWFGAAGAAALSSSGAFRPGGLSWVVAERALGFLVALGNIGQSGVQWVAATLPALRAAMMASLDHSKPLRYSNLQCKQCNTLILLSCMPIGVDPFFSSNTLAAEMTVAFKLSQARLASSG